MGVDHQLLRVLGGQPGARPDEGHVGDVGGRVLDRDQPLQRHAVVAQHEAVLIGDIARPGRDLGLAVGVGMPAAAEPHGGARRPRLLLQRRSVECNRRTAADHRRPHHGDPGVHAVLDPVGIGQDREAAVAPTPSPRVLNDEAVGVVADDRKGVAAVFLGVRHVDHGRRIRCLHPPAFVHRPRGIDRVHLLDRRLHVDDRILVDPIVGSQRARCGILLPALLGLGEALAIRPQSLVADAVVVPALHGATAARAVVVLARPLVVQPGHLIEHPRADPGRPRAVAAVALPALPVQIVDARREAEAGAGAFLALVENHAVGAVFLQIHLDDRRVRILPLQRDEPGAKVLIAKIDPVGPSIELALVELERRHGTLQPARNPIATFLA